MRETTKKRVGALVCAGAAVVLLAVALTAVLLPLLHQRAGLWLSAGVCAAGILAMIGGVIAAAVSRLRELKTGEEEEEKKF